MNAEQKAPVVIDTNIVLDAFVFNDAAARPLRKALEAGELDWIARCRCATSWRGC